MAINPFTIRDLQLPAPVKTQAIDFSPLQNLGAGIGAYRRQQDIGSILAGATDASGNLDPMRAASELGKRGYVKEADDLFQNAIRQQAEKRIGAHQTVLEGQGQQGLDIRKAETEFQQDPVRQGALAEAKRGPRYETTTDEETGEKTFTEIVPGRGYVTTLPRQVTPPPSAVPGPQSQQPVAPSPQQQSQSAAPQPEQPAPPTTTPAPSSSPEFATTAPKAAQLRTARESGKTGDDYLALVPPDYAALLKGVGNYDIGPTDLSVKGGHRERILRDAALAYPGYDVKNYYSSKIGLQRFTSGPQANQIRSIDVALDHMDTAKQLFQALQNSDIPAVNRIRNYIKERFGYDAPTTLQGAMQIVGPEVVKAVVGNISGQAEREEARKSLESAKSPDQMIGLIDKAWTPLLGGQLKGLERQYEKSTLRKDFRQSISPASAAAMGGGVKETEPQDTKPKPIMDKVKNAAEANALITEAAEFVKNNPSTRDAVYKRLIERDVPAAAARAALGMQ